MKFSALTALVATASAQTPDYLLGRWRMINVKYGKHENLLPGEGGAYFTDNTLSFINHKNEKFLTYDVIGEENGNIILQTQCKYHYRWEMRAEEFVGVNFHTTVPYSLVGPSGDAAFPGGPIGVPIPDTLEEALLDNTSSVNIMLKCRQDVHDKYCDFTEMKPFPHQNVKEASSSDSSDSEEEDPEYDYMIQRQLWVKPGK